MQEKLKETIKDELDKLPKNIQDKILSFLQSNIPIEIAKENNLTEEEANDLETEIVLVLLGLEEQESFCLNVENNVGTAKTESQKISTQVSKKIFDSFFQGLDTTIEPEVKKAEVNAVQDIRFNGMSNNVQKAIELSNWKEKLYNIAKNRKLNIEQMGILEDLTVRVMSNEIRPDEYEKELSFKITIPKEDITNLVSDVSENILKNIREIMKSQEKDKLEEISKTKEEDLPIPPYSKTLGETETKPQPNEIGVPKPPYDKEIGKAENNTGTETKEDSISLNNIQWKQPSKEENFKINEFTPTGNKAPVSSEVKIETKDINNPNLTQKAPNIFNISKNLAGNMPNVENTTTSNHPAAKIDTDPSKTHDPYREEI